MDARVGKKKELLAYVVDDQSLRVLKAFPWSELGIHATIEEGNIQALIEHLKQTKVSGILMVDVSGSELPLSDMQRLADLCDSTVDVVAIGERNEVGLFRDLLNMGVQDYIVKPLMADLIKRSLHKILGSHEEEASEKKGFAGQGQGIGFLGVVGGVGTSSLAASCAWILGNEYQKRTTLVDFEIRFPAAAQFLDARPLNGLGAMIQQPDRVDEMFLQRSLISQSRFLSLLGSSEALDNYIPFSAEGLDTIMGLLKSKQQYVICDIPRGKSSFFAKEFLRHLNILTLIVDPTIFSVRNTVKILKYLKTLALPHQRIVIVINLVDRFQSGEVPKDTFEKALERPIDMVISYDRGMPLEAINEGVALPSTASPIADQARALMKILLGLEGGGAENKEKKKSFLKNLLGG